ncbi:MAG: hypothetical protein ACJAVV_001655 [Alphaproteobacteria bacterium]|jgi:hypothetical protein
MADFDELLAGLHSAGIKFIMDSQFTIINGIVTLLPYQALVLG